VSATCKVTAHRSISLGHASSDCAQILPFGAVWPPACRMSEFRASFWRS
jgi:hypothetical protein